MNGATELRSLLPLFLISCLSACSESHITQEELEAVMVKQQPKLNTLAIAIEKHKERTGKYPTKLSDVAIQQLPKIDLPVRYKSLKSVPPFYKLSRDKSFFRITYAVEDGDDYNVYAASSYSSLKKQWQSEWDPERFNWLEIQHYGNLYRQNREGRYLELTVQSLLGTARGSKGITCTNFWHDRVVRSLGPSRDAQGYPILDEAAKVTVYETKTHKTAYAFVTTEHVYPPMKKSLQIISAVHRFDNKKNAWELLQACGASD